MVADSFTKLTQVVSLKRTNASGFASHWFFKYGEPKGCLSDNGPQFTRKLYQNTFHILGTTITITSAYQPQTNDQVENFKRSIAAMLRYYVSEHSENGDENAEPLMHMYNLKVHRSTGTHPLYLKLYSPRPDFTLHYDDDDPPIVKTVSTSSTSCRKRLLRLARPSTKRRYKLDIYKRIRKAHDRPKVHS